jgi:hypothetical protein
MHPAKPVALEEVAQRESHTNYASPVVRNNSARTDYVERGVKPCRIGYATRIALALLSRLFNWRDALIAAHPGDVNSLPTAAWCSE